MDRATLDLLYAQARNADASKNIDPELERYIARDIPSMLHVPVGDIDRIDADIAFLGVPFEGMTTAGFHGSWPRGMHPAGDPTDPLGRTGAHLAPAAIRRGSSFYRMTLSRGYMAEYDMAVGDRLSFVDVGDAPLLHGTNEECWETAATYVSKIVKQGAIPFVLGGDHTTPGFVLDGMHRVKPDRKIGVLVFDAHYDLWDQPQIGPGSMWKRLFEIGALEPENLVQVGHRGTGNYEHFQHFAKATGMPCYSMRAVEDRGIDEVIAEAATHLNARVDVLYISLDVDSIDPASMPAQKYPDPGGLTMREFYRAIRQMVLTGPELCGFENVCFSPAYDYKHHGAIAVARAHLEAAAALAARRRGDAWTTSGMH